MIDGFHNACGLKVRMLDYARRTTLSFEKHDDEYLSLR
jgi:hypothetical protein